MRIGHGYDVHRFSSDTSRPLWLGLVEIPGAPGLEGHSDADAVTHALCDAILGAANLGDLGRHFPDTDETWRAAPSSLFLERVVSLASEAGFSVESADITIVAQSPRLAAAMPLMSEGLSARTKCLVSVKATTTEGLGAIGRSEGTAATAVVLLKENP